MVQHIAEHDARNNTQLSAAVTEQRSGMFGSYTAVVPEKRASLSAEDQAVVAKIDADSKLEALRTIAWLPVIMLVVYLGLILWFRSRGGYKPVVLDIK
jgi:hypothetical protein